MLSRCQGNSREVIIVPTIDQLDVELLGALTEDARTGIMELSSRLGVARNTVQARLQRLEALGLLNGFRPEVDLVAVGIPVQAFTGVELDQRRLQQVLDTLTALPNVIEVHATTGRDDLLVRLVAATQEELQEVLQQILAIEGVVHTSTSLALTTPVPYRLQPVLEYLTRASGRGRSSGQRSGTS